MQYGDFLTHILNEASNIALEYFGKVASSVKAGDNNQVLTEADIAIGKYLVEAVQKAYPDHNIIDEETGVIDNGSRLTWVIDPIDGTSNFAAGTPDYGIMVGLLDGATPIAGGIVAPAYDRLYIAEQGEGATCNGQEIHVSQEQKLSNALVSFGIDGHQENPEQTRAEARLFAEVVLAVRNIRNSGSEAIDPMYVAEGRYGGRINLSSKIWDNVGPQIICEEAGAKFTDLQGLPIDYSNPLKRIDQNFTICVAAPTLHVQLIDVISRQIQ